MSEAESAMSGGLRRGCINATTVSHFRLRPQSSQRIHSAFNSACQEFPMTISVFIGASVDGFIARTNGDLDFLPEGGGEPHGYVEFMAGIDALVIGRKTFETVLAFPVWPYGDKRVVVLSNKPVDFSAVRGGVVEQMAGPPADIVSTLAVRGAQRIYIDGGITIQRFLRAGVIQRLI